MKHTFTFLSLLSISVLSAPAHAYRPSHGFLSNTQCDAHRPVTLEVPENSQPVPNPSAGEYSGGFFHVEEIRGGFYYMTDGVYQAVFLVSRHGIILVDAPPSIGFNNQEPAASVSIVDVVHSLPQTAGLPIQKLVYSHSHVDHIGAAGVVKAAYPDVEIIAHRETKKAIARGGRLPPQPVSGLPAIPVPNRSFRGHAIVRLGRQRLRLDYRGPVHEPGNLFIWAPRQKVLTLIDTIFPGWAPFNDLALAEDVPAFIDAHDKVLGYPFETFVGGHVNRLGARSDVEESRLYIQDIFANGTRARPGRCARGRLRCRFWAGGRQRGRPAKQPRSLSPLPGRSGVQVREPDPQPEPNSVGNLVDRAVRCGGHQHRRPLLAHRREPADRSSLRAHLPDPRRVAPGRGISGAGAASERPAGSPEDGGPELARRRSVV